MLQVITGMCQRLDISRANYDSIITMIKIARKFANERMHVIFA